MVWKLDPKSERILDEVHPDLAKVIRLAARMSAKPFKIIEGRRTLARQEQLLKQKMTTTLNSRHLTGHAVDAVPLDVDDLDGDHNTGELSWNWTYYFDLSAIIKAAAKKLGISITWGGDWKKFKDGPHWELSWKAYPAKGQTVTAPPRMPPAQAPIVPPRPPSIVPPVAPPAVVPPPPPPLREIPIEELGKPAAAQTSTVAVADAQQGGTIAVGTGATGALVLTDKLSDMAEQLERADYSLSSGTIIGIIVGTILAGIAIYGLAKALGMFRPKPRLHLAPDFQEG